MTGVAEATKVAASLKDTSGISTAKFYASSAYPKYSSSVWAIHFIP